MTDKQILIEKQFLKLLEEHRFREITIKMICEEAHINRSTFYTYYLDKYDLLDRLIEHHLSELNLIGKQFADASIIDRDALRTLSLLYLDNLFSYIYNNQKFFRTLMTVHPAQNFTQKFLNVLKDNYMHIIKNHHLQDPEYFVNYTLGGQFGIIYFWLKNNCEESPDKVADIVYRNILKTNR
ncbi:TetR family transcriptional regulator [Macrococcus brunensis]|uniref:TetR family transcriptional regulator n=1 Tax=Macrococcus brunensis TaxID=198483 RepID=A0A4R6BGQ1_9STAP|nr:TetR/AcrR family transcriptional regulator C-terminal domain-containing protein [Macrococcus brunensis]TDL99020.1 TetR family transcriptional regulator [Macrococcus brunensis]